MVGSLNVVGVEATLAAWARGDEWQERLMRHLTAQRDHLAERMAELEGVSLRTPQATYLAWLDCRSSPAAVDPAGWFRERAGVQLSPGADFGPGGKGYARLNFATGRAILDEIVDRLAAALTGAGG